jgi:very-short-patch-repair endonuclease
LCVSNEFGIIIIELDGAVHDRKVQKTVERNVLFRGAGIKLIVLNIADIKEFGETLKDHLSQEMKKIVG